MDCLRDLGIGLALRISGRKSASAEHCRIGRVSDEFLRIVAGELAGERRCRAAHAGVIRLIHLVARVLEFDAGVTHSRAAGCESLLRIHLLELRASMKSWVCLAMIAAVLLLCYLGQRR